MAYLDIWKSERDSSGWGLATHLNGDLNWITDEMNVSLPFDESYIVLAAYRYVPNGWDLFLSIPTDSGWSTPEPIGEIVSPHDEGGASLASDGSTIYIASERNDTVNFRSELFVSQCMTAVDPQIPRAPLPRKCTIFPNPYQGGTLGLLVREQMGHGSLSLSLYNVLGRRVQPEVWLSGGGSSIPWNFQELPAGTYFVNIKRFRESEVIPLKVVK